jgi:hypothetical protein
LSKILGRSKTKTFKIVPASWDRGTFELSKTYIESLEKEVGKADFSILVLSPDDVTRIRGEEVLTPRDNVLFELGLFMGGLQRERCFMLFERDNEPKLPTDTLGIKAATYQKSDSAGLEKALAPACEQILNRVSEILLEQKLSAFVAQIEGGWWERIVTKTGIEISYFDIFPKDSYKSLFMRGDHFSENGDLIGSWKSVAVRLREEQRELVYVWEGEHPPSEDSEALKVTGFGTLEFDPGSGQSVKGRGGFVDLDPNAPSKAQRKTVRIKRAKKSHTRKMNRDSLADRKELAKQVLGSW